MSLRYSFLLTALIALGGSGVALAEDPPPTLDETQMALAAIQNLSLDTEFEQAISPKIEPEVAKLGGPTSMDCENGTSAEGPETCVVTFDGLLASIPAAPAPH